MSHRSDQREPIPEFWLVWNGKTDKPPVFKHERLVNAQAEAMRLAGLHPGTTFYVLKAVNAYVAEIEVTSLFIDSVPAPQASTTGGAQ